MSAFQSITLIPAQVVTLPSAQLRDSQELILGVQRRFDMRGKQHTWVPPINDSRILNLTFKALTHEKLLEMRLFLIATAGTDVLYIDHMDKTWIGRITTNPFIRGTDGDCLDFFTIQFEGK